jgi:hypothetical protein
MFNWIYVHVINNVIFPFFIVGFLLLVLFVYLFKGFKSERESARDADKQK